MSLAVAKPKLEADIYNILNDGLKKAFKATFMTEEDSRDADEMAENFAMKGAKEMSGPLADAIDAYVKSMDIMLVPTTLMTTMGPVTGTADTTTKQITIL